MPTSLRMSRQGQRRQGTPPYGAALIEGNQKRGIILVHDDLDFSKFLESFMKRENSKLDIQEILSREYSEDAVIDAYEYCMKKCDWDPSVLADGNIKDFLLGMLFQAEVDNGGISQFFFNSSGDLSQETVAALTKVDAKSARILAEALACFPNGVAPRDRQIRNDLMDRFDEETVNRLELLEEVISGHDSSKSYYDFLQEHKEDFLSF